MENNFKRLANWSTMRYSGASPFLARVVIWSVLLTIAPVTGAIEINAVSAVNGFGVANVACGGAPGFDITGSSAVSGSLSSSAGACSISASASAGGGVVAITAFAEHQVGPDTNVSVSSSASSQYDFFLDTPTDYDGSLISIGFAADLSGSVNLYLETQSQFARAVGGSLTATIGISGSAGGISGFRNSQATDSVNLSILNDNIVNTGSDTLNSSLSSGFISIDASRPITVGLSLFGVARGAAFNDTVSLSDVSAGQSLTFATNGPVFDLPEGFSVTIPEANIFDNQWIDPRPVPLPAPFVLLMSGLIMIRLSDKKH